MSAKKRTGGLIRHDVTAAGNAQRELTSVLPTRSRSIITVYRRHSFDAIKTFFRAVCVGVDAKDLRNPNHRTVWRLLNMHDVEQVEEWAAKTEEGLPRTVLWWASCTANWELMNALRQQSERTGCAHIVCFDEGYRDIPDVWHNSSDTVLQVRKTSAGYRFVVWKDRYGAPVGQAYAMSVNDEYRITKFKNLGAIEVGDGR